MKRMASLVMAIMLCTTAFAARFGDVPSTHWAYDDIEALAAGGLVNGVGNGEFSPDTKFTVAQMAQIIANAKGYDTTANKGEYWWTAAVNYCLEIGCLPNFGAVTPENYDVECSRELAVYMVVKGLGIPADKERNGAITAAYIPDYGQVSMDYRQQILDAYQFGLLNGVDGNHTFKPKNGLARCEACAILNRAGYTTAAVKPRTGEGKTTDQIIAEIRATGLFDEKTETSGFGFTKTTFTVKDRKYGNLSISYYPTSDGSDTGIEIRASEYIKSLVYDKDGNILDENGNIFSKASEDCAYDKNGKYMPASGFSYTSRQLLKRVLNIALPTQGDEMYNAFMDMMMPPHTYAIGESSPSMVGWYDSRCVTADLGGGIYTITLSTLNNTLAYESCMGHTPTTKHIPYVYRVVGSTGFIDFEKAYELNKR